MNIKISLQARAQRLTMWGSRMEECWEAGGTDPELKALDQVPCKVETEESLSGSSDIYTLVTSKTVKGPGTDPTITG